MFNILLTQVTSQLLHLGSRLRSSMTFLLANPVDSNYMLHGRAEVILQGAEIYTFYPKNPTNHCAYQYFRTKVFFSVLPYV